MSGREQKLQNSDRALIESTAELILDIARQLIGMLDKRDGDPDLEQSLGGNNPCLHCPLWDCEGHEPDT